MDTENSAEQTNPDAMKQNTDEGSASVKPSAPGGADESRPPLASDEAVKRLGRIEKSLDYIVDHLRLTQREEHIREFSLSHLAGAVCLVLSIVFIIGAVLSLLQANVYVGRASATVAFLGAISMQGLALTLFTISRRR